MATKNATLRTLLDGELIELLIKTTGDQVYLDGDTRLSAKLTEMISALNLRAKSEDVNNLVNALRTEVKKYTDDKIAGLIDGAPTTLDTLKEIADAMSSNDTVVEALEAAIGSKAAQADLTSHTSNKSNPHGVTKAQIGLGNVDNTADSKKSVSYANTAGYAQKASQDENGRNIASTYATKDELGNAGGGTGGGNTNIYVQASQPSSTASYLWFDIS